jgi:cell wall-associated NlpC family hydrolase
MIAPVAPTVTIPAPPLPSPAAGSLPLTPALEAMQRQRVIAEALSWIGTPYRQQGDSKGPDGAIDCSMLLVRAWVDAGVLAPFDPRPYPPSWYMHHSEERYLAWMQSVAVETTAPQPGDIVLWRFGRCFSHSGVLISATGFVHAFSVVGRCTKGDLGEAVMRWADHTGKTARPCKYFDVWARIRQQQAGA